MNENKDLQVQEKKEVEKAPEQTVPTRYFVPPADIFENEDVLTMVMEMPGVKKENVDISLENDRLQVEGQIDFSNYEGLEPVYTEYNIGHYKRAFTVSNKIDQSKISAEVNNGILTLLLPKAEESKPRKIDIQ